MKKEGAAHRNTRDIAVRCTFMGSFNSQSTNIWMRCTCCLEEILFDVRFKNRGDLVREILVTVIGGSETAAPEKARQNRALDYTYE